MTKKNQSVGDLWELTVDAKDSAEVTFEVSGPTGARRIAASPGEKGKHSAVFVLDAAGEFTAVAHVDGSDDVGGFAVTAK